LQSGRRWCPGGESQSSRDEPDLSLWRRGPQNAQPTLASVCTVRIVCVARSCLSSTYLAAGTLPVRVNVVVLNTSVPNEAASFTGRSGHFPYATRQPGLYRPSPVAPPWDVLHP